MTKIKPLADRVLLKSFSENKEVTDSGIYIPQSDKKEIPFIYEVIEIGPGTPEKSITVKVGDLVLAGQYSGDEIKIDKQQYKILSIDYILAIIEK